MTTNDDRRVQGLKLQHRREMAGLSVATAAELCGVPVDDILAGERDFWRLSDVEVELLRGVYQLVGHKRLVERRRELTGVPDGYNGVEA